MKNHSKTRFSKVDKSRPLYVKRDSHKRAHKLKIKHDKGTIDNLITDLMDTYEEVQRRK